MCRHELGAPKVYIIQRHRKTDTIMRAAGGTVRCEKTHRKKGFL